jgi:demethylspheroidene O-methyltransferase
MTPAEIEVRGRLSLLFHGQKAIDVVEAALETGLAAELDRGPLTLRLLCDRLAMRPNRLYKFLDCLESLGLVERHQTTDHCLDATYRSVVPFAEAAKAVVGAESIERDRDRHAWRAIHRRLPEVLRGDPGIPDADFSWPPSTPAQVESFERSMAAGIGPIGEALVAALPQVLGGPPGAEVRWLDVGGGDGALAMRLVRAEPSLRVDVYNLAAVRPVFDERVAQANPGDRPGFVAGDFLAEPLPTGYDVLSFVRVLHDWPMDVARTLVKKARAALPEHGQLVICEELRTPSRLAIQFFWSYFLIGVDACSSRLREAERYVTLLREEGFADVKIVGEGAFEVICARG